MPFSEKTFYNHKLQELPSIKKALEDSRIQMKVKLRKNWADSKSPALQIALYRLLATEEEFKRLIQQKFDYTSMGEKIQPLEINVETPEQARELKQFIEYVRNLN